MPGDNLDMANSSVPDVATPGRFTAFCERVTKALDAFMEAFDARPPSTLSLRLLRWFEPRLSLPSTTALSDADRASLEAPLLSNSWERAVVMAQFRLRNERTSRFTQVEKLVLAVFSASSVLYVVTGLLDEYILTAPPALLWVFGVGPMVSITALAALIAAELADGKLLIQAYEQDALAAGLASIGGVGMIPVPSVRAVPSVSFPADGPTPRELIGYDAWLAAQNLDQVEREVHDVLFREFRGTAAELVLASRRLAR